MVLLTPMARELIGGKTKPALSAESIPMLPEAVVETASAAMLALIRYEDWKANVRLRQPPKGDDLNG